jgi:hypothetical protein
VVKGPDAERDDGDGSAGADEKCGEVKPAYAPTTTGEPQLIRRPDDETMELLLGLHHAHSEIGWPSLSATE